jgi:hypothetical protein
MGVLLRLKPGYPHRSQVSFCTWSYNLASGLLHREAAPVSSVMLLHRDSILVASQLVPRFRQLAIKLAPGWQKPRHASLLAASDRSCLKEHNPALGTSVVQQRLHNTTAGPLGANLHLVVEIQIVYKLNSIKLVTQILYSNESINN